MADDQNGHELSHTNGKDPVSGRFLPGHKYGGQGGRPKGSLTFRGVLRERLEQIDPDGLNKLERVVETLIATAQRQSRTGVEATKIIAAYLDGTPFAQPDVDGASTNAGTVLVLPSNGREVDTADQVLLELDVDGNWEIPPNGEEKEEEN